MSEIRTDLPFAMVPIWLMETGLSNSALRVYIALSRRADNTNGQTWPGRSTIAKESGLSLKSVDRGVAELDELGALTKKRRVNKDGHYTSSLYVVHRVPRGRVTGDAGRVTDDATPRQDDYKELDPKNYTYCADEEVGAAAPVQRDTDTDSEPGRHLPVETAASEKNGKASERAITDSSYAARLLDELGDAAPDLDEERLADNYLALFEAAKKAGRPVDAVAMGLTLALLVRTFGPLPGQARGMLARMVKANGPTAVMHAAVTTAGSTIGADPKYADDPLGPVRYLSGVVRGRK